MKLVGVNPTRCAQHVRDVLRASAGGARCSEGRLVQTCGGGAPREEVGRNSLAQARSLFSSKESIEEMRPIVALR